VRRFFKGSARQQERYAEHAAHAGISGEAAQHVAPDVEGEMTPEQRRALEDPKPAPAPDAKDPS